MNPSFARSRHRPPWPWHAAAAVLLTTLSAPAARALDVSQRMAVPTPITDGVLEVSGRRLRLPPGNWMLTGWSEHTTVGYARGGDAWGRGVSAWATLVQNGHLRAIVWLALPVEDMRHVSPNGKGCGNQDGAIERMNLSDQLSKPECLAVYGERDLRSAIGPRSPYTLRWLERTRVADPGPLVRFVYKLRSESSYGAMSLVLPTGPFEGDDEARRWALGLRDSLRAFLEHRTSEARVPALPGDTTVGNAMAR